MTRELQVGIIGYGIGGRGFHAPLVAATPGLHVSVLVTADRQRAAQAGADYPDAAVVDHPDRLFERRADLDLVVVSTPNRTHVPLALQAIEAQLPVVVDKPFAPTADEAQQLIDRAAARGVLLTVFQNRRWDSDFLTVRRVLASGRLGNVFRFESRYDRWQPTVLDNWREFGDPAEAGGLLYDLGAHIVDQALQLFGPAAEVYAELDRRRPGAVVDDDVFVAIEHAGGIHSHLWATTLAGSLNPRFRVLGDAATFTKYGLDPQEPQILAGQRPGDPGWGAEPESDAGIIGDGTGGLETVPTEVGRYQDFYAQVRDAVHGTGDLPVDPRDSAAALTVIEAARVSATERRIVTLS
jgi:predicted dehydrogenase